MKNISLLIFAVFLFYGIGSGAHAQTTEKPKASKIDTTRILEVSVDIIENEKSVKGSVVKIYKDNEVVYSFDKPNMTSYKFTLAKNSYYTMEITKPGYAKRLVVMNTKFVKTKDIDKEQYYQHQTAVSMIKEAQLKDNFYADFPIGKIEYNQKKDIFESNFKYTADIKKKIIKEKQQLSYKKKS